MGCECSGVVRDAFRARGWKAYSCDLKESEKYWLDPWHLQGDVFKFINDEEWDLGIFHPPCTYLSKAGACWAYHKKHIETRYGYQMMGAEFFMRFTKLPFPWAIENPLGCMSQMYRRPNQIICPTMFGHREPKRTCLWLNKIPWLESTKIVEKQFFGKIGKRQRNVTWLDKVPRGQDRQTYRSRTFQGIADAMALQWGSFIENEWLKK